MHFHYEELGSRGLKKPSRIITMILFLYPNPLLFETRDPKFFVNTSSANIELCTTLNQNTKII